MGKMRMQYYKLKKHTHFVEIFIVGITLRAIYVRHKTSHRRKSWQIRILPPATVECCFLQSLVVACRRLRSPPVFMRTGIYVHQFEWMLYRVVSTGKHRYTYSMLIAACILSLTSATVNQAISDNTGDGNTGTCSF